MRQLLLALVLAGCTDGPEGGAECCSIGADFEWGSATAAFQIEGGNTSTDWYQWEQRCVLDAADGERSGGETVTDCQSNLDGPAGWDLYAGDWAAAAAMGHNSARLGIEWAKIEPAPGAYDEAVIAHYRDVLGAARAAGLRPMVTLQHFTLPTWAHDIEQPALGLWGWAGPDGSRAGEAPVVAVFARFAGDMAERLGDLVDLWVTINEPMVAVLTGWLVARAPPGRTLMVSSGVRAAYNMAYAHARGYDAGQARDLDDADGDGAAALVSVAHHWRVFDPDGGGRGAAASAAQADYLFNHLFVRAVAYGMVDLNGDHDTTDAGEGVDPALGGRLDWLGVNYYGRNLVSDSLATLCDLPPCGDMGVSVPLLLQENPDPAVPRSDLGWEIYPSGLRRALADAAAYGVPIRITENGVADAAGSLRPGFVVGHIRELAAAMADGIDVRGYYHWSLMDNFEWSLGYGPRFGLLSVDYGDAARARTVTDGARALSEIIGARGVTPDIVGRWGAL